MKRKSLNIPKLANRDKAARNELERHHSALGTTPEHGGEIVTI